MRSYRGTKRLSEIINKENTLLAKLFHKAEVLQQLDTEIAAILPPQIANKAKVANISRREIVIHIESAALLTRLRLQQRSLMQKVNQRYPWANIEQVTIKVRPGKVSRQKQQASPPHRSDRIAREIESAACNCRNQGLQDSLKRLAQHVRQPDNAES